MAKRLERLPGMKCAEHGCNRQRIAAHFDRKPYCQYHYRIHRDKRKEELVLGFLERIDAALLEVPKLNQFVDKEVVKLIRDAFIKKSTGPKTAARKAALKREEKEVTTDIHSLQDQVNQIRDLVLEITKVTKLRK